MSELMSEMDRAAADYWRNVARAGSSDVNAALTTAQNLIVKARAESGWPRAVRHPRSIRSRHRRWDCEGEFWRRSYSVVSGSSPNAQHP